MKFWPSFRKKDLYHKSIADILELIKRGDLDSLNEAKRLSRVHEVGVMTDESEERNNFQELIKHTNTYAAYMNHAAEALPDNPEGAKRALGNAKKAGVLVMKAARKVVKVSYKLRDETE